jgi:uncharacterized protein with GYD domain
LSFLIGTDVPDAGRYFGIQASYPRKRSFGGFPVTFVEGEPEAHAQSIWQQLGTQGLVPSRRKQSDRTGKAKAKLDKLGIKIESIHYTQGCYDFVDIVDAPNQEAMLASSVWYAAQGLDESRACPPSRQRASRLRSRTPWARRPVVARRSRVCGARGALSPAMEMPDAILPSNSEYRLL